jgi:hypothetical protein
MQPFRGNRLFLHLQSSRNNYLCLRDGVILHSKYLASRIYLRIDYVASAVVARCNKAHGFKLLNNSAEIILDQLHRAR